MASASDEPVVDHEEEECEDISDSDVITKYRQAANIANLALQGIISMSVAGANVVEICKFGDTVIERSVEGMYRAKKGGEEIEKGIAFPTCVSVNEVVCHNSPLESEAATEPLLKDGDVVKIDLGVHIDGYIAVVGHTHKVGATLSAEAPLGDDYGNLMTAAHVCSEVATRLVKPGNNNHQVSEAWAKIAEQFKCNLIHGTASRQLKRFIIDGNKAILLREEVDQKAELEEFEKYEVYGIDIALSSGDGKPRESEKRTTVYKRAVDKSYRLKMRASRYLFNEMNSRFPTLPFTLRAFDDEKQARMGVVECQNHDLVIPYPVLLEREGTAVVHFKFTVLVTSSGTVRITGLPFDKSHFSTENTVDEEIQRILDTSAVKKKNKKKNKKKAAKSEE